MKNWKTSLIGLIIILSTLGYIYYKDSAEWIIFIFGIVSGVALLFAPDSLLVNLKKFLNKNSNKEI